MMTLFRRLHEEPAAPDSVESASLRQWMAPLRRLFVAATILITAASVIYGVLAWREARRNQLAELRHLSEIVARSTNQIFDSYSLSLRWFAAQLQEPVRVGRLDEATRLLRRYHESDPNTVGVTVLAPDGRLLATSLPFSPDEKGYNVKSTVGAGEGFAELMAGSGPRVTRTILPSRVREWSVPLRFPVRDENGKLEFIVSVLLSTERLANNLRSLSAPPGTVYLLLRPDGHRQLRVPAPAKAGDFYGKPSVNVLTDALRAHPERRSDEYEINRATDTTSVIGAYTRLENYPLAAAVSLPRNALWHVWGQRVIVPLSVMFVLFCGVVAANANARRLQRRLNQQEQTVVAHLRDAEDRLTLALEGSNLALWDWNSMTGKVYLSERWSLMMGGEPRVTHVSTKELLQQAHIDDHDALKARLLAVLRGELATYYAEFRVRNNLGEWIWIASQGRVFERNSAGRVLRMSGTNTDITARKNAEQALRASEERFRASFDQAAVGMALLSVGESHSRMLRVNQKLSDMLGYSREELLHLTILDITFPEDVEATIQRQTLLAKGERTFNLFEKRLRRKDGRQVWASLCVTAVHGADGRPECCISLVQDISERKQLEDEQRLRDRRQRHAFVREIHHRIKNHIQGVAGLLTAHARRTPALAEQIKAAVAQLQAVAAVHGLQGGENNRLRLKDILPKICASVQGHGDNQLPIDCQFHTRSNYVLNEDEAVPLALIVNELLTNAIKYTSRVSGAGTVLLQLHDMADGQRVSISNPGQLPEHHDSVPLARLGDGLRIVRSLLPPSGVKFEITNCGDRVCATLELRAPAIALDMRGHASPDNSQATIGTPA